MNVLLVFALLVISGGPDQKDRVVHSPNGCSLVLRPNQVVVEWARRTIELPAVMPVTLGVFSGDGSLIALVEGDRRVHLYDPQTGQHRGEVSPRVTITALAWRPGSLGFATGHQDGSVTYWGELGNYMYTPFLRKGSGRDPVTALLFSPDDQWLASLASAQVVVTGESRLNRRELAEFRLAGQPKTLVFGTANQLYAGDGKQMTLVWEPPSP